MIAGRQHVRDEDEDKAEDDEMHEDHEISQVETDDEDEDEAEYAEIEEAEVDDRQLVGGMRAQLYTLHTGHLMRNRGMLWL